MLGATSVLQLIIIIREFIMRRCTRPTVHSSIQLVKRQRKQMCFQLFAELCDDVTES